MLVQFIWVYPGGSDTHFVSQLLTGLFFDANSTDTISSSLQVAITIYDIFMSPVSSLYITDLTTWPITSVAIR